VALVIVQGDEVGDLDPLDLIVPETLLPFVY